jgi:cysteinyl-tRNA synthetase
MKIFDTLTAGKRDFVPLTHEVKLYVCGVTPYATSHVGHAMSYIVFDVLRRYLEFQGYSVRHVQNFTDIDDKLIQRAHLLETTVAELAEQNIELYFRDMDALGIKRAHIYPRATQEMPRIIDMISGLIQGGFAYPSDGDVYFRVNRVSDYGRLGKRNLDSMVAGARVEVSEQKENPMDFVLWKKEKPGEPSWSSPWGDGRPGWHIECSAMSMAYLGETIDIHGGGQDLIFPHHENEIAQSEAYTGKVPFSRFWMHNGLLQLGDEKMSKSLGNLVTIQEALERYSTDALRLFFLSSHYRNPLAYSHEGVLAMEKAAERLRNALQPAPIEEGSESLDPGPYRQRFTDSMDDDFNSPQALAVLFDLTREINRAKDNQAVGKAQEMLRELTCILGLNLLEPQRAVSSDISAFIDLLVNTRTELRAAKQWVLADQIRDRLVELNVVLEDTSRGTGWKYRV